MGIDVVGLDVGMRVVGLLVGDRVEGFAVVGLDVGMRVVGLLDGDGVVGLAVVGRDVGISVKHESLFSATHTRANCRPGSILITSTVMVLPDTMPVHVGLVAFNFANNFDGA